MAVRSQIRMAGLWACAAALVVAASGGRVDAQCVDHSTDPAGCQPSTFDTPMDRMPAVRVNRLGKVDPTSSEVDAAARAAFASAS